MYDWAGEAPWSRYVWGSLLTVPLRWSALLGLATGTAICLMDLRRGFPGQAWPREWPVICLVWMLLGALTATTAAILFELLLWLRTPHQPMSSELRWGGAAAVGVLIGGCLFFVLVRTIWLSAAAVSAEGVGHAEGTNMFWNDLPFVLPWVLVGGAAGLALRGLYLGAVRILGRRSHAA